MKAETFDRIFKICILLIAATFVAFYSYSIDNGRYEFGLWHSNDCVRDTKTGDFYVRIADESGTAWVQMNDRIGETHRVKVSLNPKK